MVRNTGKKQSICINTMRDLEKKNVFSINLPFTEKSLAAVALSALRLTECKAPTGPKLMLLRITG